MTDHSRVYQGLKVLVTRPAHQAEHFCQALTHQGATPLVLPVFQIQSIVPTADTVHDWHQLNRAQSPTPWLIFTSTNAVEQARTAFASDWPPRARVASIGQATTRALEAHGCHAVTSPQDRYDSEALLATLRPQLADKSHEMGLITGEHGRDLLQNTLQAWGHKVRTLALYQRVTEWEQATHLQSLCLNAEPDIVSVTSNTGLQSLLALADANSAAYLKRLPLIVNSQRCKALAQQLGFTQTVLVASPAGDSGQLAALAQWHHSQR